MNQPPFLNALAPVANRGYERIFPVTIPHADAYQLINAAVFFALNRLAPGCNCAWVGVEGATCYYLETSNLWTQIHVLRLTTHAAKLCVHPMIPSDPIQGILWLGANNEVMIADVAQVFAYCEAQVRVLCREAAQAESYEPSRPKSKKWEDRIDWLDTYHFDKSAEEQAELLKVPVKTLHNRRAILNRPKSHRIFKEKWEESGT